MPQLNLAAEQFDRWMKDYEMYHRLHGNFDDLNRTLVEFLNGDDGFRYVKTYEEFCELAVLLQAKGYKTTNPPCEPIEFGKAIKQADPTIFGDTKPVIPESVREQLAAENEDSQRSVTENMILGLIINSIFENPSDHKTQERKKSYAEALKKIETTYESLAKRTRSEDTESDEESLENKKLKK